MTARTPTSLGSGDRLSQYRSSPEAEARLLILIDAFSRASDGAPRHLQGRLKLAKLDFLLRHPSSLSRLLGIRDVNTRDTRAFDYEPWKEGPIDARMIKYRFGPWDPAYYAIIGSLVGRGLVVSEQIPERAHAGYRTTERGRQLALTLLGDEAFAPVAAAVTLLRRHFDLSGTRLKNLVYQLPEVSNAKWNEEVR